MTNLNQKPMQFYLQDALSRSARQSTKIWLKLPRKAHGHETQVQFSRDTEKRRYVEQTMTKK